MNQFAPMLCRILFLLLLSLCLYLCDPRQSLCAALVYTAMQHDEPSASTRIFAAAQATDSSAADSWRRVRNPGASGGKEFAAILRVAALTRSDPRLAGLMLRCAEHGVEAIIIVVEPFPPHARPKITLRANEQESYLEGVVIPTGVGVRLPVDGAKLATGPWRNSEALEINIDDGAAPIHGVVELSGLTSAVASLIGECASDPIVENKNSR
ncbi:hypothetical protein [Methylocapsa acidiphila]|uniref:hypothetical protein n=1 Tax=Methylocapsa acidiphila TaxID=133552 RepID=UPI00047EF35C|nr:hypothetical protein [Methylocapsa acidiphila]